MLSPPLAVVEETAGRWLLDLLGLPRTASVGFTTGCQMANFAGLAAGRRSVLLHNGWDVERDGLPGCAAGHRHRRRRRARHDPDRAADARPGQRQSQARAGGRAGSHARRCAARRTRTRRPDDRLRPGGQRQHGSFDPLDAIADAVAERPGTWLHVDGAFGLWAGAFAVHRHLVRGAARADSWATDSHKWLNVPYDSGVGVVRDPDVHRAAMMLLAAYLQPGSGDERDSSNFVPEFSRRARGFAVYAALRSLGRSGIARLVDGCCAIASRMAERLRAVDGVTILNDVVLNQVLVRFEGAGDDRDGTAGDTRTRAVIGAVQRDGTCWLGGTTWRGRAAMRVSISGWQTTADDIERSAAAILGCLAAVDAGAQPG